MITRDPVRRIAYGGHWVPLRKGFFALGPASVGDEAASLGILFGNIQPITAQIRACPLDRRTDPERVLCCVRYRLD